MPVLTSSMEMKTPNHGLMELMPCQGKCQIFFLTTHQRNMSSVFSNMLLRGKKDMIKINPTYIHAYMAVLHKQMSNRPVFIIENRELSYCTHQIAFSNSTNISHAPSWF